MGDLKSLEDSQIDKWKQIIVICEPMANELSLAIFQETKVSDVIETIKEACIDQNVNIDKWLETKTGGNTSLCLIRKKNGNIQLPPDLAFGDIEDIEDKEIFKLDALPVVG